MCQIVYAIKLYNVPIIINELKRSNYAYPYDLMANVAINHATASCNVT